MKKLPGNWAIVDSEAGHMAEEGEVKIGFDKCFKQLARRKGWKQDWPEAEKSYGNNTTQAAVRRFSPE